MQERREEIKCWLSNIGKNYKWLAEQCFIGHGAVLNWMSTKPIPNAKWEMIKKLMAKTNEEEKISSGYNSIKNIPRMVNGVYLVSCPFTNEQWEDICEVSKICEISPEQFIVDAVKRALEKSR